MVLKKKKTIWKSYYDIDNNGNNEILFIRNGKPKYPNSSSRDDFRKSFFQIASTWVFFQFTVKMLNPFTNKAWYKFQRN